MRPPRTLLAAGLAVTISSASVLVLTSGPAAAAQPDHLVVLAGSPHFVAYADYPVPHKGKPDYTRGELHVYSDHERDRDLGSGFGNTDPASAAPYKFSIVDSMLTGASAADPSHVEWWDLAADTHGLAKLPAGARWQGSAPTGWVMVAADHETVEVQSVAGDVTTYGEPLPAEAVAVGTVATLSGPKGFAAFGAKSGSAAYERWDTPNLPTPLDFGDSVGSSGLSCSNVTGVIVGCVDRVVGARAATHLAVPVNGSPPRSYVGCNADSVGVETKLVWVCPRRNTAPTFARGSRVTRSAVPTTPLPGVSALGRYVTLGPRQRAMIAIHNSHRPVHVLVAIPSPLIKLDDGNLRAAAREVAAQAVKGGALPEAPSDRFPAQQLQTASVALLRTALANQRSARPQDTRSVMGRVPGVLRHHVRHRPRHRHIRRIRSDARFRHAIPDSGSGGIGTHATHGGATAAPFRAPDGVYVDPRLDFPADPTVGMVALHTALQKIGQPYVWAGAGPNVFDCSGLTQWAYAHAGLHLVHFTGSQWNQGRLIKPRDILPGDLILFSHPIGSRQVIHHVGMYLGAGWMVNAPYTGQYVNVVKVPNGIAGIVRP